jgi:predicted dehydrogenase
MQVRDKTMKKVRCAIVGLGRIGSMLEEDRLREKPASHAGAVTLNRACVLVGGCDINPERRRSFRQKWDCPAVYTEVERLLQSGKPDILHIATPPGTHLEIVEKALGSSVRLIICEKPLADSSIDASRIAAYHTTGAMKIMTNHERRYSKDYLMVKRHIERRDFGSLLSINSRIYMGKNRPAFQMLLDDGTHLIDVIRYLTSSELHVVRVVRSQRACAETLLVTASAATIPVIMEIGSGRDHVVFELDMSFSSGRIRIGNGLYEEFNSGASVYYEGMNSLFKIDRERPKVTGYFAHMLEDAVRCARDFNAVPVSTAVDGYRAVEFIDVVKEHMENSTVESAHSLSTLSL